MLHKINSIKDTVWNGCAIGLITPIFPGVLVWLIMQNVAVLRQAHWLLIGCVAINVIVMNYFFKQNKENLGRGIVSVTFLWAFAFCYYRLM